MRGFFRWRHQKSQEMRSLEEQRRTVFGTKNGSSSTGKAGCLAFDRGEDYRRVNRVLEKSNIFFLF